MNPSQRLAAFLRPSLVAALAYAAFVGLRASPLFHGKPSADFIRPGTVTAEQLPEMGVDKVVTPKPELSPADVVQTQLAGLSDPKADGVGVFQCYVFASPANRQVTGPLDRFAQMVRQEPFACLARPHATLVGESKIDGALARLLVTVMDENHRIRAFTFILSRQTEKPFENCWMTESVFPLGGLAPPPAAPEADVSNDAA